MNFRARLDELRVKLKFVEFPENTRKRTGGAIYLDDFKVIFADTKMDDIDIENALLHDFRHAELGHQHLECSAPALDIQHEMQAEKFKISYRVAQYLESYDEKPDYINVYDFLDFFHLPRDNEHYDYAEKEFKRLLE